MPNQPGRDHYRRYPIKPLALGLNDAVNSALLENGETPDCRNVDFDSDSVAGHGGAIKFNNQPAPHSGILTRVSFAPLFVGEAQSVPQRGYAFVPYSRETDIGGDFELFSTSLNPSGHSFHARRGRSFSFSLSFSLPIEERLYHERPGAGSPSPATAGVDSFDEALEECTLIAQKGGDAYSPLSWALGIVNTADQFEAVTGEAAFDRVSNYALVFMWNDSPGWGAYSPAQMRYAVGAGDTTIGSNGRYCTMGLRALIAKAFIEPGREYHVAVNLSLDSGSPGDAGSSNPDAVWNSDGTFEIVLRDEAGNVTRCATHATDLFSWKGPADNYDYLTRYGVRFSGRDPMFLGLGYRFAPWASQGFAPFGLDSASMEQGGFRMVDVSASETPSAYPAGQHCTHGGGNSYIAVSLQGMHGSVASNLPNPTNPTDPANASPWPGLYDLDAAVIPNQGTASQSEALRNCWVTIWGDTGGANPAAIRGARFRIAYYTELAGTNRLQLHASLATAWATNCSFFVTVFRWHQRPLRLSNFRVWTAARDYTDARTLFSLSSYSLPDDETEPDIASLALNMPLDDAGGGVLRELSAGRSGYLAPYALGKGGEGLFLSGEGEALCLDFSEDSVLTREFAEMLRSGSSGFAVEIACVIPQAYYARQLDVGSTERVTIGAPILVSWECKEGDPGYAETPKPILRMGHRARLPFAYGTGPFHYPCGFNVELATGDDQSDADAEAVLHSWASGLASNWSTTAEWVGERIRIQVGVQSTGTADEYEVYIAASPKVVLNPETGDPSEVEFAYFETRTISRRDLARSVVTIGGAWRPDSFGYTELNARMIVEDVRVFGAAAPGALPASSGVATVERDGKLIGTRCLPPGALTRGQLLHPLGSNSPKVNVTESDATVTPADASLFFQGGPEDSLNAVAETYLLVAGDGLEVWVDGTIPEELTEFYYVKSVAAGGGSLELSRNFNGATRKGAFAASFRVIGYTHFTDNISAIGLPVGGSSPFIAGATTADDAVLAGPYFKNLAPPATDWFLRVYASQAAARDIVPLWARGVGIPRRNPVLGMASHQGRVFAATRGALYLADDRWVDDGPTDTIKKSLAFRGALVEPVGISAPLANDMVSFAGSSGVEVTTAKLAAGAVHYDAWVWLDEYAPYQTVMWVGERTSDPGQNAGSAAGTHKCHVWTRLAGGSPEIAFGSTGTYDGTNRPEKGLFVARSGVRIPLRTWTHVRWTLSGVASNAWLADPVRCFINGREVSTRLLATENGASAGQWIRVANLVALSSGVVLLGAARDSFIAPAVDGSFTEDALEGECLRPNRYHGYLHSLDGRLARVAASVSAAASSFNPHTLTYSAPSFMALDAPEGVGHKVADTGGSLFGVIESHPAISLFHEMGMTDEPASWARYGSALFVTTGGRPVHVQDPS